MFKMSSAQINELCKFAFFADKEARSDLYRCFIVDENDYTSNFTGALRRIINANSQTGLKATSYKLQPRHERKIGTDAAIVIESNGFCKIVLFEAKWPRISQFQYPWDYPQSKTQLSHFSSQIDRQSSFSNQFAIFEMFYCEYDFKQQPNYMKDEGSTCIWHREALNFKNARVHPNNTWTNSDLQNMLSQHKYSIDEILRPVCQCTEGKPLRIMSPEMIAREYQISGEILLVQCSNEDSQDSEEWFNDESNPFKNQEIKDSFDDESNSFKNNIW